MGAIGRTDIELVEASLRGEHEAFGHLVARYQDVVCAVSYSSTGDQGLSEDVAQETFIAAWRQLDRLRNSARLRPWLCGIARNLARIARKRKRREPLVEAGEQIAPDPNPFDLAARGDVERVVRDALARIPDAYREVLVLYYREDQSIREVAETLGLSEAAVMQRLSRGRRYLADSVSDLVERSLRSDRRRRDLVAAVLASITVIAIPSRVDASPTKGSTMLKFAIASGALVAAGTTAYLLHSHYSAPARQVARQQPPTLRYGSNRLGLAHPPALGPTAAPRLLASRFAVVADLELLPADSDVVLGVNFAQLRQSAIWQRFVEPKINGVDEIYQFGALCGFDPVKSLSSISVGLKGMGESDQVSGVIVLHGFEKTKAMSCFDKQGVAEVEKDGSTVTIDGDIVLLTDAKGGGAAAFTFIDNTTALIVIGPAAATRQGVERIAAGNSGLQTSSAFADALQAINTDDSVWLILAGNSPLMKLINAETEPYSGMKLGTIYVSMNMTDTLALDIGVRMDSPQAVAKAVSIIQKQMTDTIGAVAASAYFDQLDVLADGSDLIISVAIAGDQLMQLISFSGEVAVNTGS